MPVKFSPEDKAELNQYLGQGVHKVKIKSIEFGVTDKQQDYADVTVENDEGQEGNTRLFFTEAARKFSFNTIRSIFVHNAEESKKDAMRDKINAIKDSAELEKMCQGLVGKECWYTTFKSTRTYTDKDGNTRNSFDKNVYGYEPQPKQVSSEEEAQKIVDDSEDVDLSSIPF